MHATEMPGLAAGPMGTWLAAVGVLRAQSRADPAARLHWDGTIPVITTASPVLVRDLADRSQCTPVITPWQSGGGWGPKDKTPRERLLQLRNTRSPRLSALRRSITAADKVMQSRGGEGKDALVRLLRGSLPDEAVPWLDAAVPLRSGRGEPGTVTVAFAPLAGTGGNDARWDLSTTYHAAILALDLDREPEADGSTSDPAVTRRRTWLHDLLDGTAYEPLLELSSGPYWPAATEAKLANPWAITLTAEGLCAFGDSPAREYETREQPWVTGAGPETGREDTWGEAWLPLWGQPMTMPEVSILLGGPQPRWRGRAARTPAQMYSSLRTLGWPRGITGYARYALARRRGKAHTAVPLDLVTPDRVPAEQWLQAARAASRAGVAEHTWTGYVARGQAPGPDRRDPRTGRAQWMPSTVDAWLAARPGPGTRTDLGPR